ncbi:MAG: efflux RND transporter periplasmic adaptor subunit [Fimbriimonadaceae bacterium]|nr:efflux RND transporter periplasmic adaptor subunit [Fimbriimonadaceae bacterium]
MKKVAVVLLIVVVVICGIGGYMVKTMGAAQKAAAEAKKGVIKVERGEILRKVVETGTADAVKAVEVRSRATGRLLKMYVQEGDIVKQGQLIAEIDPQETQLRVDQDNATLSGARSSIARQDIEIEQRRITAKAAYDTAVARLAQLQNELVAQPKLTSAAIRQAKANLDSAKQGHDLLLKSTQPNARTEAQRALTEAKATFDTSEQEYKRIEELVKLGYVAGQRLDTARQEIAIARVRLRSAQDQLDRLDEQQKIERSRSEESIRQAQAEYDRAVVNSIQDVNKKRDVEQAQAEVARAKAGLRDVEAMQQSKKETAANLTRLSSVLQDSQRQLNETKIIAPVDGVVAKRYLEIGDLVTGLSGFSQGTAIFRIEDRDSMRVRLEINEIDTARLKVGMEAIVTVDALPEKTFKGTVKRIAPASTSLAAAGQGGAAASADAVVKYEVEVWLANSDSALRSGMSAKCTMEVLRRDNVLRLPAEYVGKDKEGSFVMLKGTGKDAKPKRTPVQTGASSGAYIEILSGVSEGAEVDRPKFTGPERQGFMQAGGDGE